MGSRLLYYGVILPISLLPFWLLYGISNFLYLIIYQLIGYRKKVVRENLKKSFPEKTQKEILKIESKFYSHFCDLIVESLKAFSIRREEAKKRMKSRNVDLINKYYEQNKQVVLVGGHYGNWELYAIVIGMELKYAPLALYTPLKDQFINAKITKSRSKYGLEMLSIFEIKEKMKQLNNQLYAVIFGADQSPRKSQKAYWMQFLNQETGVQFGTEKFAVENNAVVIFGSIHKLRRGHYEVVYELICEDASKTTHGFITQTHTRMLEKNICQQPEHWLWSHKRWKHSRPEEEVLNVPIFN